jgi:hypothetical protein
MNYFIVLQYSDGQLQRIAEEQQRLGLQLHLRKVPGSSSKTFRTDPAARGSRNFYAGRNAVVHLSRVRIGLGGLSGSLFGMSQAVGKFVFTFFVLTGVIHNKWRY